MSSSAVDTAPAAAPDPLHRLASGTKLVVFGASWCTPWVLLEPVLARLASEGIDVCNVDIDAWPQHAERFRVMAMPTFAKVVNGAEKRRLIGACGYSELRRLMR